MKFRSGPGVARGTVRAPPSKSYTHRALLLAALSRGSCRIRRPLLSEDTEATAAGVEAFGAEVDRSSDELRVRSHGLQVPAKEVDARNSGTTLRLLTGTASLVEGPTVLTGDESLRKRPMGPLLDALGGLGASARSVSGNGRPPVEVRGFLRGGDVSIPGTVSSQFVSSLLLACPLASQDTHLTVVPPVRSEPYVEITLRMLAAFGGHVAARGNEYRIAGRQSLAPRDVDVPGDFSSAAFPFVAAAITGGDVTVEGLDAALPQGDRAVLDLLRAFGAHVEARAGRIRVRGGELTAHTVDLNDTPDLFPVLAVLATQARGESRFLNGAHLRLKESDRIETTTAFLRAMGADITATEDGCVVRGPSKLHGAFVESQGDHRILMAAAVAGLAADDIVDISDPWCFRVSYPTFLDDLRVLGAPGEVLP